ncbi:MAG: hypothetical protein QF537_01615 [SAR324 cluster bacterium]|nr:hypothetical protein [SAR324 cluster bacterium]
MSEGSSSRGGYKPQQSIELPPLYARPPRPVAAVRWLLFELLFPWGFVWIGLAFFSWHFLTPSEQTMAVLEPGWIFQIWVRNVCLLLLLAGGLHAWLYLRRAQKREYKYNTRWPSLGSRKFLWQDQVKDNMFWSLVSGCFFWTLFEALTHWYRASGNMVMPGWSFSEGYLVLMLYAVFFWSTFHFYLIHRLLHWPPLYKAAHAPSQCQHRALVRHLHASFGTPDLFHAVPAVVGDSRASGHRHPDRFFQWIESGSFSFRLRPVDPLGIYECCRRRPFPSPTP